MTTTRPSSFVYRVQQDIDEICQPIFQQLSLNYFHYFCAYKDGSAVTLYSRTDWHDYFYESGFKTQAPIVEESLSLKKANICLWQGVVDDHVMHDASNLFNVGHPLSIVFTYKDHFECFAFAGDQSNHQLINTYFNNVDLLLRFTHEFRDKAAHLILEAETNRFTLGQQQQADALQLLDGVPNKPLILQGTYQAAQLTPRELSVAQHMLYGYTTHDLAEKLNRSPRTIETHMNSLKDKLNCKRRSDLQYLLMQQSQQLFQYVGI
ncbi:MAG: helix-turn-helix transcriptional regulator [Coxiellaceae bacterium]|nr:helix-turn-helix transcriptional regulator [Coxiellaceae bacterium]